jgi:Uma2 family endonuclease
MSYQPRRLLTAQGYLALERRAEFKSEFFAAETFAMAGASRRHNLIVANVIRLLGNQLLQRHCNVYPSDMRVKISKAEKYTYPNVVVACGEEVFEDEAHDTSLNPVVIVEVWSESTEAYDHGKKLEQYQALESLMAYILIAQEPSRIEQYSRQSDGTWTYRAVHEIDAMIRLPAIGCELALRDVYAMIL